MKIGWIGGWGVSLEEMKVIALAHAPDAEHLIYPPVVGAAENLSGCDAVIAWSLGAHLVLEAGARGVKFPAKVLLFAPFTSFCSEHGKCGKHSETQVKWLRRWIDTDAPAALADFRKRAGLAPLAGDALPYEKEYLQAGLDLLSQPAGISLITFGRQGLNPGWEAYVGDQDTLLNPEGVCQAIAGCHIVGGLGHDLREFLAP
ncbi:hypothetical protein LBMAG55_05400 [Verrucomicrobiota bacterium]|nr:hypothetical protein LBMAG55_05400 [Verrucomicrobiota bacterium]